jgi:hypothetical protein
MIAISLKGEDGTISDYADWAFAGAETFRAAVPWRTFRWHQGQKHFPGSYWASTNRDLVIYESRLELARLLYADFDPEVEWIVAQPFLMARGTGKDVRRHVPDFFLATSAGPVVVDVKPQRMLRKEKVAAALAWAREAVEARGWRYEVWSEPPEAELANIRMLAGCRREWLFNPALLAEIKLGAADGMTIRAVEQQVAGWPLRLIRSAVLHLLWTRYLTTDLSTMLSRDHVIAVAG